MDTELSSTFYEVQAEKFYQKKVEVARGVIELGQILKETKEGLNTEQFIQWLSDSRVGFKKSQAYKYIKIANEYDDIFSTSGGKILNQLSVNKLFELASAPDDVKEDVANSKDKEEAEKKIKEYEERLKQEKLARESLIKSNQELQEQVETAKENGFREGKQAKIDEEKSTIDKYYRERYDTQTSTIRREYQKRLDELGSELDSTIEELDHYKDVLYKDKEVNREYQRLEEQSKKLKRKINELEQWGTLEANLDLAVAQATALITGDIGTNENDNEALILSISRTVNRLRKITKLLEDNFDLIGETTIYKEDGIEIIDVEGI